MLAKTFSDDGRIWFIMTAEPNRERVAAAHLIGRGFTGETDEQYRQGRPKVYLPTEVKLREYTVSTMFGPRRRTRTTIEPIFRGLIFLRLNFDLDSRWLIRLRAAPGIHNFHRFGSQYAVLSDVDMDDIVRIEYEANDPKSQKLKQCPFKEGDRVTPRDGPLAGEVMEFLGLDASGRIGWLSSRIGRVELAASDIEAA